MTNGEDRDRRPLVWRTLALLACLGGTGASAQYPSQPVKILLPYAAGGVADITARVLAQRLSQPPGKKVIIDNRRSAAQIDDDLLAERLREPLRQDACSDV